MIFRRGSYQLPSTLVLSSFNSGEAVRQSSHLVILSGKDDSLWGQAVEFFKSAFALLGFFGTLCTRPATKSKISARASKDLNTESPPNYSHPERQSSSANQPSFHSASLELFARDLLRNQRFRLGLRTVIRYI